MECYILRLLVLFLEDLVIDHEDAAAADEQGAQDDFCKDVWILMIKNLWYTLPCSLFPGSFSPKAYPVMAVKAKLRELATGTATVMLAPCSVHTYRALPH